ncbi:DUF4240 domain-containing protein [Couchioplanes caeruleus]|uniref:DUF4240 domain-containing protein n=1 Tax=Couchioplanes caeruleus TaxID=56438 RepID=UPI0020BFF015|nr:DUF4240 domain-containing protein [Couchioplanes caeruleus]UQU66764.1 DUF4240 domain-containing protein [Couchioplanes caeruleus]
MPFRVIASGVLVLMLSACVQNVEHTGQPVPGPARSAAASVPEIPSRVDEAAFWRIVETARVRGGGDPYDMAELLESWFADAQDRTLREFQRELIRASARLYTWRHGDAAEMMCGGVSDDVFTDWRSWVITLGRETYSRVAENPDNLADVEDLSEACDAGGEFFGAAAGLVHFRRHGDDDTFPVLEPDESPSGRRLTDPGAVRRALPRLAKRLPDDGLGRPPLPPD